MGKLLIWQREFSPPALFSSFTCLAPLLILSLFLICLSHMLQINTLVINFDAELRFLRHKKLKLDVQMKTADLHYITLYEELLILRNLEKHENLLQSRVNTLISEQKAVQVGRLHVYGFSGTTNAWLETKASHKVNGGIFLLCFSTDPTSSPKFWKIRNLLMINLGWLLLTSSS